MNQATRNQPATKQDLEDLRKDLRKEFQDGIQRVTDDISANFASLMQMLAERFERIDERFEEVDRRFDSLEQTIGRTLLKLETHENRLIAIEQRHRRLDQKRFLR